MNRPKASHRERDAIAGFRIENGPLTRFVRASYIEGYTIQSITNAEHDQFTLAFHFRKGQDFEGWSIDLQAIEEPPERCNLFRKLDAKALLGFSNQLKACTRSESRHDPLLGKRSETMGDLI